MADMQAEFGILAEKQSSCLDSEKKEDLIPKEEKIYQGEVGKLDAVRGFHAKDSEENEYLGKEIIDWIFGHREDFEAEKYLPSAFEQNYLIPKEEKISQEETSKLDAVRGKKSNVRPYEGKGILKKEKKQLGEIGTSSDNIPSPCIFKSPFPKLEFQKPELVSIGPYHRDKEHQLDKYKHSFLEKLLHRTSNNPERVLCSYVEQFIALEKRARACYSEDLVMSRRDFVKMMLVDGCFTIELLRHFGGTKDDLFLEDPNPINIILPWQIPILVQDLLLLENQIPFFVLEKLFELSKNDEDKPEVSLTTMALKFFDLAFPRSSHFISEFSHLKPNHLLDLFVKTVSPSNPRNISNLPRPTSRGKLSISNIRDLIVETLNLATLAEITGSKFKSKEPENQSYVQLGKTVAEVQGADELREGENVAEFLDAFGVLEADKNVAEIQQAFELEADKNVAELLQAGIAFRPSRSNNFLDFNFKDGILEIPPVTINELFSTILVNSAAWENCPPYYNMPKPVTSYIYFMSSLIKEANDVQFLCSKGIISRLSNNDKEVADLSNLLRTYVSGNVPDSHFRETIREIQCYNGRSRKPMRQFLMETSVVLVMYCAVTHLIICLFYLRYIPRKLAQFLSVFGNVNLICLLSLQRSWHHVLRIPAQLMVIISTFVLFLLSLWGGFNFQLNIWRLNYWIL